MAEITKPNSVATEASPEIVRSAPVAGMPPAGWHPDPQWGNQLRYWDGAGWTEHVAPRPGVGHGVLAATNIAVHSQVIVTRPKSAGVAFMLTFFFGSLGMFYSTVPGGLAMTFIGLPLALLLSIPTFGLAFVLWWIACMAWGVIAADS